MKKLILIILTGSLTQVFAQIPNAGFEQVTTSNFCGIAPPSITAPTGYWSNPNTNAVTTVAHSGAKAAMISVFSGQAESLTTFDCSTFQPYIVYTGAIPTSMTAWVRRAASLTNDTLSFTVLVNDNAGNPLASGSIALTGPGYAAYTQVTVPMMPVGTGVAAQLLISMSGCVVANSSWYVDDLDFPGTTGISSYGVDNFSVNYNSNTNTIEIKTQAAESMVTVCVYDVVGKKLIETPAQQLQNGNTLSINTQGFQSGIYLVQAQNKNGLVTTKRILIQ